MARFILLDAGPIGMVCLRPGTPTGDQCRTWVTHLETSPGVIVVVPAIADYEVRRELARLRATAKLRRLDALRVRFGCLGVSPAAFDRAAGLWASVRHVGLPAAADKALDADAILAGLAGTMGGLGDVVTIATINVRHFSRFPGVDAELWSSIT